MKRREDEEGKERIKSSLAAVILGARIPRWMGGIEGIRLDELRVPVTKNHVRIWQIL